MDEHPCRASYFFRTLTTLERGVPIDTVDHMLGCSDIQRTERYAQVTPTKLFDDFARLGEFTKELSLELNPR